MASEKKPDSGVETHGEGGGGGGKHGGGGGGGGKHKKHHGHGGGGHEEVNLERWLVSYADFMTLLFCLFVMLYAISNVDKEKMKSFAQGMMNALGGTPAMQEADEGGGFMQQKDLLEQSGREILKDYERKRLAPDEISNLNLQQLADYLELIIKHSLPAEISKQIDIQVHRGIAIKIRWPDYVLFLPGNKELDPKVMPALERIGKLLNHESIRVVIEGVSDKKNLKTEESVWDLSSKKALVVLHYLVDQVAVPPQKITVSARGNFKAADPVENDEQEKSMSNYVVIIFPGDQ